MKTQNRNRGSTLSVALITILLVTALIGAAYKSTSATARLNDRGRDFVEARLAAEGTIEYAFSVWKQRLLNMDRPITTTEATAGLTAPTFTGYDYSAALGTLNIQAADVYGVPMTVASATPAPAKVNVPNYPGWSGRSYNYVTSARLSQTNPHGGPLVAGASRHFQYLVVPLFQSMYFYENDFELYLPATMTISGLIHTNSNAYVSTGTSGGLTIQGNLSYVGNYYPGNGSSSGTTYPAGATAWSSPGTSYPPTYSNGGASAQVHQVSRYEPLGAAAAAVLSTTDTNPNNDSFREIIEPPSTAIDPATGNVFTDPPEIANRRMYNQAGIIMTINGATATPSVTVTTQNGASLTSAQITSLQAAVTGKTTITDQREGTTVDVTTIDVSKLIPVLNAASNFNGVLYVYDTTPVTTSDPQPKALRLKNGGVLPTAGLTIASQNPVYVQGDYNTGTTTSPTAVPANSTGNPNNTDSPTVSGYTRKPAAVMGDAVMLLSNSWNDANSASSLSGRDANNTTYNMAILSGVIPSGYLPPAGDPHYGQAAYGYSGGANNYPRFLETWSNNTCTFYGSMIQLFASKTFTGKWDTGNIYAPPTRRWNFDTNFTNTPPPGSLDAIVIGRGNWAKF